MTQTISCPSCQRMLRVPDNLLGQAVKCPSCSKTFTAPEGGEEAPPPRPSTRSSAPPRMQEEERPSRQLARREDFDDDEDERPSRRRRPRDEDDYDDEDDDSFRRGDQRPGKVQAIAIMTLVGGILATLTAVILMITIYGLCWPGTYYSLVMGIMAIVKGSQLLGKDAANQAAPSGIAIMQIINIINCDWINMTLGIINLVFLGDEEVKRFFRQR